MNGFSAGAKITSKVNVDWNAECIFISFDYRMIDDRHAEWRRFIRDDVGTGDIDPNPYNLPVEKGITKFSIYLDQEKGELILRIAEAPKEEAE